MPRTRLSWFFFLYKRLCCFFKNILHAWMCQRKSIMAKVEVGERGQFRKIHAGFERAVGSSRATVLLSLLFSDFFFFFSIALFLSFWNYSPCVWFFFFYILRRLFIFFSFPTSLVLSGRRVCGSLSDGGCITNSQSSSYWNSKQVEWLFFFFRSSSCKAPVRVDGLSETRKIFR